MTKSKNFLHPLSILSSSKSDLESNYATSPDASPSQSSLGSRISSRSPKSNRGFKFNRRPSTLGYEQVLAFLKFYILIFN